MTVAPDAGAEPAAPSWRRIADGIRAEHHDAADEPIPDVDPADFDLAEDCCLGGCCAEGTAYLAAVEQVEARRAARARDARQGREADPATP